MGLGLPSSILQINLREIATGFHRHTPICHNRFYGMHDAVAVTRHAAGMPSRTDRETVGSLAWNVA